jgi:hypothetical protein
MVRGAVLSAVPSANGAGTRRVQRNTRLLKRKLASRQYREVFLSLGKTYLLAVKPFEGWRNGPVKVTLNRGRIGEQLKVLKAWMLKQKERKRVEVQRGD